MGGAILTLIVAQSDADTISDWVAEYLEKTVVGLKKPGGAEVALEIYFDNTTEAEIAARALEQFPLRHGSGQAVKGRSIREYAAEEWTESWKKHFKPMDIGDRLRVCPPWLANSGIRDQESGVRGQETGDSGEEAETAGREIEIVINPGLSFGTGNHFTTRFCLEQLDRFVPESGAKTMLDIGTGSGILAIASIKLGAKQALGVDFDELCVEQSILNAEANGVAEQTEFFQYDITQGWPPDALRESVRESCIEDDASLTIHRTDPTRASAEKYDMVCANIYSSLLIDNAATLLRVTKSWLLLTGIREVELDGVADTFVQLGGREIVRDCDGEWGGLVFAAQ